MANNKLASVANNKLVTVAGHHHYNIRRLILGPGHVPSDQDMEHLLYSKNRKKHTFVRARE